MNGMLFKMRMLTLRTCIVQSLYRTHTGGLYNIANRGTSRGDFSLGTVKFLPTTDQYHALSSNNVGRKHWTARGYPRSGQVNEGWGMATFIL